MDNLSLKRYDVIYVGNYTKDTIVTPDGTRYVDGGAVNYAAHAAARLGYKVAVATRLAREDKRMIEALESAGVDCFPVYTPSSTLMKLVYKTHDVDQRTLHVTGVAGTVSPNQIACLSARAVVVGTSLRGEVEPVFFEEMRQRAGVITAVDVQGFVRVLRGENLVYEPWDDMKAVIKNVDILKSDMVEAEFLTGETVLEKAARVYASYGVKEIVLTHSRGVLIHADGKDYHFEFHSESMDGRSGRGDTCLGTYVVKRLSLQPWEAGKWAAAVTSMKVERLGPFNRPVPEVEAFINHHYAMV
jgi:sugar/nucleoside kinase (ribokinase family)